MKSDVISIKGARVNNLKNITLDIPRDKFIVITGVSGSGKSSLAFDTLYAEGQRRYVESLSTYARQFMGRLAKPECDFIEGIPPAIAIEQKVSSRNPRSTVGTSTEIYDYLRMLYARIGHTFSPVSGKEVKRDTTEDVVQKMLSLPEGTKMKVLCPLVCHHGRSEAEQLDVYAKQGLTLTEHIDGETYLVIARIKSKNDSSTISHLVDSCETALYESHGRVLLAISRELLRHAQEPRAGEKWDTFHYSLKFEADGMEFEEPSEQMFSFNSPAGACPECEGFGRVVGIDEALVIPDQELSLYDGAVMCWRGAIMSQWKDEFIRRYSNVFPIFTPYYRLTQEQKDLLWHGELCSPTANSLGSPTANSQQPTANREKWNVCIDRFFDMLGEKQYKIQNRVMLARYRGKAECPLCHGRRLRKEAEYVKVGGRSITQLCEMPIDELYDFFQNLKLSDHDGLVAKNLLVEIKSRLGFLMDVGLHYLTLSRLSNTLSGGESQRINLTTSLGSSLVGSLYILDEPSIGLHSRDTQRLISVLRRLQELGNTVVVVEHDEEIIRAADYIIDIGPDAGRLGGEVVYEGELKGSSGSSGSNGSRSSHTLDFLSGKDVIEVPRSRRRIGSYILIKGARANNLKGIDVRIPLNIMTVITGVSGSGKSSLVRDILYRALQRRINDTGERPAQFAGLEGDVDRIEAVEFIDQNPIGTSTRSNPVTYIGAYDEIRKLLAGQQLARQMGFRPQHFSFNAEGGRCEECKGEGVVKVEMQFMNDLTLVCEACHGKRFKDDVLEVTYQGRNVNDILNMTVNQAMEFFTGSREQGAGNRDESAKLCSKITKLLGPLQDVGLGYIKLGQNSSSLSGGENQRVKLAYYLSQEKIVPTMFIFDEPTTGLHFHDIKRLLAAFHALISRGHTVLIIEHNMEIIKCADHIIDLGPEGGKNGGEIVCEGTPEKVARCSKSHTGQTLKNYLAV